MKRTLLSVMVLLGVSAGAHAENLLDIYQQAQIKDPQLLQSKPFATRPSRRSTNPVLRSCRKSIWVPV